MSNIMASSIKKEKNKTKSNNTKSNTIKPNTQNESIQIKSTQNKSTQIKSTQDNTLISQKFPNYFNTLEEYNTTFSSNKNKSSNNRYKQFTQNHFTAGDIEQFEENRNPGIQISSQKEVMITQSFGDVCIPKLYFNYSSEDVYNTFKYIFYKFKKGIFIQIKDGKPLILPFSNINYRNDWNIKPSDVNVSIFKDIIIKNNIQLDTNKHNINNSNTNKTNTSFNPDNFSIFFSIINQLEFYISKYGTNNLQKMNINKKYIIGNTKGHNINKFPEYWYGNNGLIRYEFPVCENDTNLAEICDMIISVCNEREIPDMEFFINKRDFPILTNNKTEAYKNFYGETSLKSHNYETYCPILSFNNMIKMEKGDNIGRIPLVEECKEKYTYADILIPTPDDWANANKDKIYSKKCFKPIEKTEWKDKIPVAIFRGSSTGLGTSIDTKIPEEIKTGSQVGILNQNSQMGNSNPNNINKRLQLCYISKILEDTKPCILDAKITKWNLRPRFNIYSPERMTNTKINTIHPNIIEYLGIGNFMDISSQAKYKYIIHVEGHSSAYRLSKELESGSLILKVESQYKLWFEEYLIPYKHYIPIKEDLSDLIKKIKWCISNDSKCEKIAKNSTIFFKKYLSRENILNYLQKVLINIKNVSGEYRYEKYNVFLDNMKYIEEYLSKNSQKFPSFFDRTVGLDESRYKMICELNKGKLNENNSVFNRINNSQLNISLMKSIELYVKWIAMYEEEIEESSISHLIYTKTKKGKTDTISTKTKSNSTENKLLYEAFIGIFCINQLITKHNISNFMYTFGIISSNLLLEKIEGITFQDWIRKKISYITKERNNENSLNNFFREYLTILISIISSIEKSHIFEFMHNDLYPWNIVIKDDNNPVIIDYDKSSFKIDNRNIYWHADNIPYKFSRFNDVITIIISSLNLILKQRVYLYPKSTSIILRMINFFIGGKYIPKKFTSINGLKVWLKYNAKYSINIISDKSEFDNINIDAYIKFLNGMRKEVDKEEVNKTVEDKEGINKHITFSYFELYKYLFTEDKVSSILKMYKKKIEKNGDKKSLETSFLNYIK